jgi:hypothetical protein
MSRAIPPLPQYAFMAWCSVKAQEQLYLYIYLYILYFHCCIWRYINITVGNIGIDDVNTDAAGVNKNCGNIKEHTITLYRLIRDSFHQPRHGFSQAENFSIFTINICFFLIKKANPVRDLFITCNFDHII